MWHLRGPFRHVHRMQSGHPPRATRVELSSSVYPGNRSISLTLKRAKLHGLSCLARPCPFPGFDSRNRGTSEPASRNFFSEEPRFEAVLMWCSLLKVSRHFGERNVADVNNLLAQVLPECLRCGKALETLRLGFGQKPLLYWTGTIYIHRHIWIHLASNNLVFFKVKAYDHKTDACLFTFCIQCLGGRGAALADQEHLVTIGGLVQPEGWLDPCLFGPQLNSCAWFWRLPCCQCCLRLPFDGGAASMAANST